MVHTTILVKAENTVFFSISTLLFYLIFFCQVVILLREFILCQKRARMQTEKYDLKKVDF